VNGPGGRAGPLERVLGRLDEARAGTPAPDTVSTGFPSLDLRLGGGIRRRDLVVLGGDVGSGKSALALAVALRSAAGGVPTLYLSGEMDEERVAERALAIESRVSIDDLRLGRLDDAARSAAGAATLRLRALPLAVRPLLGGDFDELRRALDAMEAGEGGRRPVLVVVDSLQHVEPPRPAARSAERLAAAVRALKALALAEDVAVLATAQLPGLRGGRADQRPTLDDLGAFGAVKQLADVVLALYREEMYRPGGGVEGATELLLLKNRNGPTGFVDLYFHATWLRVEDLLDPEP